MSFSTNHEAAMSHTLLPAVIALELAREFVERYASTTDDPVWGVVAAADSIDDALAHLLAADFGKTNDR